MKNIHSRHFLLTVLLLLVISLTAYFGAQSRLIELQGDIPQRQSPPQGVKAAATGPIKTVFIILMENNDWAKVKGASAPYITNTLLPMGAHAEQYFNPSSIHPSLPNYLWLEAGTNFGILDDNDPSANHQSTTAHLVTLLQTSGLTWKEYAEGISGTDCPLTNVGNFAVRHQPFTYFDDVTNGMSSTSQYCIQHERPYTELATDLQNNTVANYNFITPDLCDDMHDCSIQNGDTWLAGEVPKILNSQAYKNGGAVFITWDEGEPDDGPIGMIVLSPFAKTNYQNTIHYTHSSTLRTFEEIFGLSPMLGDAANATDLSDFFTIPLTGGAGPSAPAPSISSPITAVPSASVPTVPPPTQPANFVPSPGCLGPCAPSLQPTVFQPTIISQAPQVLPSVALPCHMTNPLNQNKPTHARSRRGGNGNWSGGGGLLQSLLQFFQQLLALLLQLFGGNLPSSGQNPGSVVSPVPTQVNMPTTGVPLPSAGNSQPITPTDLPPCISPTP